MDEYVAKNLLIIGHAPSVNTKRLFESIAKGAQKNNVGDVSITVKTAFEATAEDVLAANAVILFTPENFAYMSGALKDFFDRSYYGCLEKTDALPCAIVIRAGNDGTGTERALTSIINGLRWNLCQQVLICRGDFDEAFVSQCEELGEFMTAGLEAGII